MNNAVLTVILLLFILLLMSLAFAVGVWVTAIYFKKKRQIIKLPEVDETKKLEIERKQRAEKRFFDFIG